MSFKKWLRNPTASASRRGAKKGSRRKGPRPGQYEHIVPRLEQLEDRLVPAGAANNHTVLILGSSMVGTREATAATNRGFTVEIASDAAWLAKTQADFATYRAIIIGDDQCNFAGAQVAAENASTWGPVVNGNMFITGADPILFGSTLAREGIDQG